MSPLYSKFILTVLSGVSSTAADLDSQTEATSTIPDPNSHSDYNIFNEDPESVKIIRSENYHDGMGNYKIDYAFDTGVSISEVGKLNENNSISFITGYIWIHTDSLEFSLNYTAIETFYTVHLSTNDSVMGLQNESENYLESKVSNDPTLQSFGNSLLQFKTSREATLIDGKAFMRAIIKVDLDESPAWAPFGVILNITEPQPYGIQVHPQFIPSSVLASLVGR